MAQAYATDADLLAFDACNTTPAPTRAIWLELASTKIDVVELGTRASFAHALLTLHMMTLAGVPGTSSGPSAVASKTIGPLSISYDTSGPKPSGPHATTSWGVLLDLLLEGQPTIAAVGRAEGLVMLSSAGPRFR